MYRRYALKKKKRTIRKRPSPFKRKVFRRRRYYKKRSVNPRLSFKGITVPVSQQDVVTLSTAADTVFAPAPALNTSALHSKFAVIYNKYRVMYTSISVQPNQFSSYYFGQLGYNEPLKYVVYKVAPDMDPNSTNTAVTPNNFKDAMRMPGARAYPLTRACRRSRPATYGVIRNYQTSAPFDTTTVTKVRQACRTPWLSTTIAESDDPLVFGWAVWFPEIFNSSTNVPPAFQVISSLYVRYIMPSNLDSASFVKNENDVEIPYDFENLSVNNDCAV